MHATCVVGVTSDQGSAAVLLKEHTQNWCESWMTHTIGSSVDQAGQGRADGNGGCGNPRGPLSTEGNVFFCFVLKKHRGVAFSTFGKVIIMSGRGSYHKRVVR